MLPDHLLDQKNEDLHLTAEDESNSELSCIEQPTPKPKDQESFANDLAQQEDEPKPTSSARLKAWPLHLLVGAVIVLSVWLNPLLAFGMMERSSAEAILMLGLFLIIPSIFYLAIYKILVRRR